MRAKILMSALSLLMFFGFKENAAAQYSFSGDVAVVSNYVWRSYNLNDASLQPGMTVGIGGFAFNAWGTMDLTDYFAPDFGEDGLKGQFSEIDYTFSYDHSFDAVSVGGGVIVYTFQALDIPTTTEIYGSVGFDSIPLAPSVTVYVDLDEFKNSVYTLLGAGHTIPTGNAYFPGLDLSATFAFNRVPDGPAGVHDFNVTASVPITINDNWSASGFVAYNQLLGDFKPETDAGTFWGGATLSLGF